MATLKRKKEHVRAAGQTRPHTCHWPRCKKQVPPAMWGCYFHWMKLPKPLRDQIWRTYRVGQEERGEVSKEYIEAAEAVQEFIRKST